MFGYTFFVTKIRKSECKSVCKTKTNPHKSLIYKGLSDKDGGLKRIRTAVRGFADLCLATRPSDHLPVSVCKYTNFSTICKKSAKNSAKKCKYYVIKRLKGGCSSKKELRQRYRNSFIVWTFPF